MDSFSFYNPTRVHFGTGMIENIGKEMKKAGIQKALLIAGGGSIRENSVYTQVTESLKTNAIVWTEAWGVQANPTLDKVRELISQAKKEQVDAVLAVGGGSVIDSAKSTAVGVYMDDIWKAYTGEVRIDKALPIFTVLTISATGSEMNSFAVLTNSAAKQKWSIGSPLIFPKVSIIDPSVQCSLPFKQTVNGALDAMAHILEFYFMDGSAIATVAMDGVLLRTIAELTDRLKLNAGDLVARSNLAWIATLALNGYSGVGLKGGDWACHAIEHAFSALYPKIAHGEGLGVIFPAWIKYASEKDPARFTHWAKSVWDAESVSHALRRFREKIASWGSATSLRDLGIKETDLPVLRDIISQARPVGKIVKFTPEEIEELLMLAY